MGEVFLADDTQLGRKVAIKFLAEALEADETARERLHREARSAGAIDHPFVCKIHELADVDGRTGIVMEHVTGETLQARLRRAPLSPKEALEIAGEVAEALEAAHKRRVVHRDLKPSNVMLTDDGHVKVMDFGLAKQVPASSASQADAETVDALTESGVRIGTPGYMSPEQLLGGQVDERSDIFAFGILLYELLAGVHPFTRASPSGTMSAILRETPSPVSQYAKDAPESARITLDRLLPKEPHQRYQSFGEVRTDLGQLLRDASGLTPVPQTAQAAPGPAEGRTPFVGRESERAEARRLLERAVSGYGGVLLLGGEPGVGKTRLAEEVLAEGRQRGCLALTGRCYETEGTPPFIPWVEIVERSASIVPKAAFREALGDAAPEVAKLVPELRQIFPDIPQPTELAPEQQQRYLFSNFVSFVERGTQVTPQVLLIDDLHWADDSTLLLLQQVALRVSQMPLLIVGTYRDVDLDAARPFAKMLESLTRQRLAHKIALRCLPEAGVSDMLRALSGYVPAAHLVAAIFRETEGNPFFVEEVFQHLAEEGRLFDAEERWRADLRVEDLDVPESIRLVISRRVERLSPSARQVLTPAAVIGRSFDLTLLEALGDADGDTLLTALEEAEGAKLIRTVSSRREVRWEFAHGLIRHTLENGLSLVRRRRAHLRVAEAMERVFGAHVERHASDVAHHLYQAGTAADPEKTARFLTLAGDQALDARAFDEALRQFNDALSIRDEEDQRQTADLRYRKGRALLSLGRWEEAIAEWKQCRRGLTRFVGRDRDMEALVSALEQSTGGDGQVVGVVAEAGTGKSRLCYEFLERCRERGLTVLEGRAVSHGKNIPFLPMLEVFRAYYGITAQDDDRTAREKISDRLLLLDEDFRDVLPVLFEFFGVPDPDRPAPQLDPEVKQQQLFAVLRKVVQGADPRIGQFVTLIEDLHWMDSGSAAFLEEWVEAVGGTASFLLVTFRPEFSPGWTSKSYYRQIQLAPLGREAVRELVDDLLGSDVLVAGLAGLIHERTGGNPFFAEEIVQSLIELGRLVGSAGRYRLTAPIDSLEVPSSVQTVLAARIDRLGDREKEVLATAAVIGRHFAGPILMAASEQRARDVEQALGVLAAAEFVSVQSRDQESQYVFKHALTQEVALGSQLQDRRQRTHAAVARALEDANGERLDEIAAVLAHHWEEADERGVAAEWHRRAAAWAGTNDVRAALYHWQQVRDLAQDAEPGSEHAQLAAAACSQILAFSWRLGASLEECARVFEEGRALAERAEDLATLASLTANYAGIRGLIAASAKDYVRYGEEAKAIADRCDDLALRCSALGYLVYAYFFDGRVSRSLAVCDELLTISEGDPHLGTAVAAFSPASSARHVRAWTVAQAGEPWVALRELALARDLAFEHGYPEVALWTIGSQGLVEFLLGRTAEARTLAQEALRVAENQSAMSEIYAHVSALGPALALERDWKGLADVAREALRRMHETGAALAFETIALDFLAAAQLELGQTKAARDTAGQAVALMVETGNRVWSRAHAQLIRSQLALNEPAARVEESLTQYATLLEDTGKRLFEAELHELRASLARREGDRVTQQTELRRAHDLYTSFGVTIHAERLARELRT